MVNSAILRSKRNLACVHPRPIPIGSFRKLGMIAAAFMEKDFATVVFLFKFVT